MKTQEYTIYRCNGIPDYEHLVEGILYVSIEYGMAIHLCACGCKSEVSTPIQPFAKDGWVLSAETSTNGIELPTLHPSIGSFQIECKSHYFIKSGKVVWC